MNLKVTHVTFKGSSLVSHILAGRMHHYCRMCTFVKHKKDKSQLHYLCAQDSYLSSMDQYPPSLSMVQHHSHKSQPVTCHTKQSLLPFRKDVKHAKYILFTRGSLPEDYFSLFTFISSLFGLPNDEVFYRSSFSELHYHCNKQTPD